MFITQKYVLKHQNYLQKGYVITYLEVTGVVDARGQLDFKVIRGQTGSTDMVFQLVSNYTDFLSFSYLSYGIKEEEYRKVISASYDNT